jgi:hypothetical protein
MLLCIICCCQQVVCHLSGREACSMLAQLLKRERHTEVGLDIAGMERSSKRAVFQCTLKAAQPHVAQASVEACMAGLRRDAPLICEGQALREAGCSRFEGARLILSDALLMVPCSSVTTATRSLDRDAGDVFKCAVK